jgi:hypothetical protein
MEHGPSHIHYELVPLLPVASNHIISAFQWGHQAFPLVKVKTTNGNTYDHTYYFLPIIRRQNHLIMGQTWYVILAFDTSNPMAQHVTLFVLHFIFYLVKVSRWWKVTRSLQPHVLTCMFCPYVISTLYQLLEDYKWELSKDTFLVQFFSQLNT